MSPTDILRKKKKSATNGPWDEGTSGWLLLAYGPFRRLYGSSPEASRLMAMSGATSRLATLFKEDATLSEAEDWLVNLNYRALEKRAQDQRALDLVLNLIGEDFLRQGVEVERVDSEGLWLTLPQGQAIRLKDMSDGYRAALALLLDITRHMIDQYGIEGLITTDDDGTTVVARPGVCLIDEIDAHLHPSWQREIGPWLTRHFPAMQFIVTTHSPLVAQSADKGRIYHLPSFDRGSPEQLDFLDYHVAITGRADEVLASAAFGLTDTRSPRVVRAREEYSRLEAKRLSLGALDAVEEERLEQLSLLADQDLSEELIQQRLSSSLLAS